MVLKRPLDDEGTCEISSKHLKQVESRDDQLVSFSESVFSRETSQKPNGLEEDARQGCSGGGEKLDAFHEHSRVYGNTQTAVPGCLSLSSWTTCSANVEDSVSDVPIYLPVFPEYFSSMSPLRTFVRCEDIYSILLDNSPRKSVAIGPNHQADILHWDSQERKWSSNDPHRADDDSRSNVEDEDGLILMGTCVVPMKNMTTSTAHDEELGRGRNDCSCEDKGSVRCARQHILEAREKLVHSIGLERFIDLGLNEMGEQVAERWSAEEQQLFHETVFANPASLGKNFWNNLSAAFPSRSKKEIVSYYFSVFMLRRRAEQNRNEAIGIDSDNDEWQGHDDVGDSGLGMDEDNEDSVIGSAVSHDPSGQHRNDYVGYDEHVTEETYTGANRNSDSVIPDPTAKSCSMKIGQCGSSPVNHMHDRTVWSERCEQDVPCTSSYFVPAAQATNGEAKKGSIQHGYSNGIRNGSFEYVMEPCDYRVWNPVFSACSKNKADFLPTCSMIEEVFGDETWEFQGKR